MKIKNLLLTSMFISAAVLLSAAAADNNIEELKAQLKNLDSRIVSSEKKGNKIEASKIRAQKSQVLERIKAIKASSAVTAPATAPAEAVKPWQDSEYGFKNAEVSVGIKAGFTAGIRSTTVDFDYSIDDYLPYTKLRVAGDLLWGSNPVSGDDFIFSDLKLGIEAELPIFKSVNIARYMYLGMNVLYPWKVDKGRGAGSYGIESYVGGHYYVKDFGVIYAELGWAGIKYNSLQPALSGFCASVGYEFPFQ